MCQDRAILRQVGAVLRQVQPTGPAVVTVCHADETAGQIARSPLHKFLPQDYMGGSQVGE